MIKAGEAGGALETILQRLAQFLESAESLKRKVKGAMIYPVAVVLVAILILAGIMYFIVPTFKKMFEEFELALPAPTVLLLAMSDYVVKYFWLMILLPICCWLIGKIIRKFKHGRVGFDMFIIKVPIFGSLIERNILARTTRTLGTLISSGVPILEALNITRETAGNAMFERIFNKVIEAIREGDVIAKPMKDNSIPGFHPMALFYWAWTGAFPGIMMMSVAVTSAQGVAKGKQAKRSASGSDLILISGIAIGIGVVAMSLWYLLKMRTRVIDDLVVNMIDVGEETGELDTMLYKVADNYDEEVRVMTEGLTKLIEPMLIVFLGVAVGFIVVSLFMPLIELITSLSGGGK
jgi:type IV pilus assembly protein PilC